MQKRRQNASAIQASKCLVDLLESMTIDNPNLYCPHYAIPAPNIQSSGGIQPLRTGSVEWFRGVTSDR